MKKFKKNKHAIIPEQETNFDMVRNMISVKILENQKTKIVL